MESNAQPLSPDICQSIIEQINSIEEKGTIIAYDNDHTPFNLVFLVLRNVVPLSEKDAFLVTEAIHFEGYGTVFTGCIHHCRKIGDALDKIRVDYKIY